MQRIVTHAPSPVRATPDAHGSLPIGTREFILMMVAAMSNSALSIDPMLPALPHIGADLGVAEPNQRQAVITFFFIGIAGGALFYGPISDHFGRKPVLLAATTCFLVATVLCAVAPSFPVLLVARMLAGFCAAAFRVLVASIVRDCYRGDMMARTMSFVMFVFMFVPILAPSFGAVILAFASWRAIFWSLALLGAVSGVWLALRLPETLPLDRRVHIRPRDLLETFRHIVTHRSSMGYMIGSGIMFGALIGFLTSIQQIFFDVFHRPDLLPAGFAAIGLFMATGSLTNGRFVQRFGARRISHGAMIALILLAGIHTLVALSGREGIVTFIVLQGLMTVCFSFGTSNFGAIALEPFSRGAGLASSIQTSLATLISVALGGLVGVSFNGSVLPLTIGYMGFGTLALLVILWAERGRLFTRPGLAHLRSETPPPRH